VNVWRVVVLALSIGVVVAPSASAQHDTSQPETARFGNPTGAARTLEGYIYGVVKKVGTDELILDKPEFGDEQLFKLEAKTKYIHDGKPSALGKLKVGDEVWLDVKRDKKTGDMTAVKVVTGIEPTETKGGPQT